MALSSWWQEATPQKEIREGRLSEAVFAADLGDVISGAAPLEYRDANIFYQKTYLTKGLENLLRNVLTRLQKGDGDPVIQLQTPFGGGKTHALLALYHAVENRAKIKSLDKISRLPKPQNARVVSFVGTHADPIAGKTPWGEIADQLGVYSKLKIHDEKRRSPGRKLLDEVLGDAPVLILMDELVEYCVKAKDFSDQVSAFSQEITETVKSKANCCLVCTLPSSAPYGEAGERALNDLQRIFGRLEAVYSPVEGIEIYELIRKRLFEDFGSEKIRSKTAQSYFDLYQKLGTDVPSEVREIDYRDKIERAYPFHPELIDVLYERWGSFSTFQRTRGVLRLLAEVVADLYKRQVVSPLIQSSLVNLENRAIRSEFIKHIGNEYESVIAADIAGKNAKAPKIDKEMGSEYEVYGIASGIATSVFLNSFSGAERKETTLPRVRVALLREGIPHSIVGDAIGKLEEELWFFHSERKQFSFKNQPNLNRIIVDREETVSDDRISEELKKVIQDNSGTALETYVCPEKFSDVPDNRNLKLAILSPDYSHDTAKCKTLATETLGKAGMGFRAYRNTLFVVAMDSFQLVPLLKAVKHSVALSDIHVDKDLLATLAKESRDELGKKAKEAEKDLPFRVLAAYRHLASLDEGGVLWQDLGIPTVGARSAISDRVRQYLRDQEKILTRLTPRYILEKTFIGDEKEKGLKDILEISLKTPGMPILDNENVLFAAVREGVANGLIGARLGSRIYYEEDFFPTEEVVVLRGDSAKTLKEAEGKGEGKKVEGPEWEWDKKSEKGKEETRVRRVVFRARVPWDKMSSVTQGVIRPLKDKGSPPEIVIEITANSQEGFDRTTLDSKVKETLRQIGAKLEEWKEE